MFKSTLACKKVHPRRLWLILAIRGSRSWALCRHMAQEHWAGPDGWLTICPILYLPALTTSLVKFHFRPNHIVKLLSKVGMVFPENNCPQTVEEALLIRFLNISYSFVCSKIPEDFGTYVRFRPNKTHCKSGFSSSRTKQANLTQHEDCLRTSAKSVISEI